MRPPQRKTSSSWCRPLVVASLGLVLLLFWLLFIFLWLAFDWSPEQAGERLFSYTLSLSEYRKKVPGLLYDDAKKQVPHAPREPVYYQLGDLLSDWNPDDTRPEKWPMSKAHPNQAVLNEGSVDRFDFQNEKDMDMALQFRQAELPFLIYNMPTLDRAADDDAHGEFGLLALKRHFGSIPRIVEKSKDNHFMYYSAKDPLATSLRYPKWTPPQIEVPMTFSKFLKEAERAEEGRPRAGAKALHYMTMSAGEGGRTQWVKDALPFLTPSGDKLNGGEEVEDVDDEAAAAAAAAAETGTEEETNSLEETGKKNKKKKKKSKKKRRHQDDIAELNSNFFIVDPSGYHGINCRFGMRGVVAEAHYDGQRNFVAMVRGRKRYILLPPRECDKLSLLPHGHPSGRHSFLDWSSPEVLNKHRELSTASATEVVLSRGEILYIPSYWFHYIVSQDASVQCNARSGNGEQGKDVIKKCGHDAIMREQEQLGSGAGAEGEEGGGGASSLRGGGLGTGAVWTFEN